MEEGIVDWSNHAEVGDLAAANVTDELASRRRAGYSSS
jgi:hypothetical protein